MRNIKLHSPIITLIVNITAIILLNSIEDIDLIGQNIKTRFSAESK
jgi:hypothetical protein